MHFYFVCLMSFVFYVFHNTGKFNDFDWTIYWADLVAKSFLPPMFLHFCLEFPRRHPLVARRRAALTLIYVPAVLLLGAGILFVVGAIRTSPSNLPLRDFLDDLNVIHFGALFLCSAGVLLSTYRTAHEPELRQQMKWVTRGTVLAVLPYFLFQSLPRTLGFVPPEVSDVSVLPLAFIPISFGWAIHRYRLMDVDILFKRGAAYTLATMLVVGLYVSAFVIVGELFGEGLPQLGVAGSIVATIVAALLFAPTKDRIQIWLDKFFYKDRYNLRLTVSDFGRRLGAEVDLAKVLDRIVERLSSSLSVDRMAVLLEDPNNPDRFVLARSRNLDVPRGTVFPFLTKEIDQPYVIVDSSTAGEAGLLYFIPCRAKDRVIAYLGMGPTNDGGYLTSEDLELLEGISEYVGIAVENATLYQSLEDKATQYEALKDFNENIIESISVGVMVEVGGKILGWNRALEHLTGKSPGQMLGKLTSEAIPPASLERLRDERNLYKHRWDSLVVNFSAMPLVDKEGRTTGRLIIVDDITERVRLEDQIVQNDKLTSIGLLAAGVAHEVNTPLAVISSYSQLLRKQFASGDQRQGLTDKIIKQTFRASEIVNNLLSFSRTSSTEFAEIDVHQVVADTLSLVDHQLKSAGVEVRKSLDATAPLAFGNAGKLQQVFLNLFLNARDAMTSGGCLTVRTDTKDSRLRIWVEDTGTGISGENIKKIYDPFFTTKAVGEGTGLGLSVSYGIVQEHGGELFVDSAPGRGTSFRLELPLARRPVNV
jgi:PAS domain S-box-containing protein